ncbi:MAG: PTS system mannose/fructose/sorbose family transporter subunit IID [Nitrospirota bacterium]
MNDGEKKVRTADLLGVLWRSFLIQASWSFDRMQTLGFAYAMLPVLRRLYPDGAERASRLKVHMEYFNTQPYLAAFILGAAARLEQERAAGRGTGDVSALKSALMAPLGALGDSFFWGSLKPLAATVAVAVLMAGAWWAPLLFLVVYNTFHLVIRAGVFLAGYRTAGDAAALLDTYSFTKMARLFKAISLSLLGGLVGAISLWKPEFRPEGLFTGPGMAAAGLVLTLAMVVALRKGFSPLKLMLGLAAACLALAYGGVGG